MVRLFYIAVVLGMSLISHQSFSEQVTPKRDPTKPVVAEVFKVEGKKDKVEETYTLSSIIVSPTRRLALINEKFVKVGDTIGEASVLKINKNSVLLSAPGKKITIYLFDQTGWE